MNADCDCDRYNSLESETDLSHYEGHGLGNVTLDADKETCAR
jgi:hypothetical protein